MPQTTRYYVKCSRACKTPGMPISAVGKDQDGLYTYPNAGYYLSEEDARRVAKILENRFPKAMIFMEALTV